MDGVKGSSVGARSATVGAEDDGGADDAGVAAGARQLLESKAEQVAKVRWLTYGAAWAAGGLALVAQRLTP